MDNIKVLITAVAGVAGVFTLLSPATTFSMISLAFMVGGITWMNTRVPTVMPREVNKYEITILDEDVADKLLCDQLMEDARIEFDKAVADGTIKAEQLVDCDVAEIVGKVALTRWMYKDILEKAVNNALGNNTD